MEPLQAGSLDPFGGITDAARMVIECGADAYHDLCVQKGEIVSHEEFLLGTTNADPDDVWTKLPDFVNKVRAFGCGEIAKRRRSHSDDASMWRATQQRSA